MCQGVHHTESLLEGDSAHGGGHQHLLPSELVVPALHGRGEMLDDHPDRLQRDGVGHRVIALGNVSLQGMGERVHARLGRNPRREAVGQLRVAQGHAGHQPGREKDDLPIRGSHGDDSRTGDLGARARRGRNRHQRRQSAGDLRVSTEEVVVDLHRLVVVDPYLDRLGGVHRAAAAEGDQGVRVMALEHLGAGIHLSIDRVGRDVAEQNGLQATRPEHLHRPLRDLGLGQTTVGHQEWSARAEGLQLVGQVRQHALAENDPRRVVESRLHSSHLEHFDATASVE